MKLNRLWRLPPRSYKNRIKIDDIAPDGVCIRVQWDKFVPGTSVFIPCVNVVECVKQVYEVGRPKDWVLEMRDRIEGGRWGVRVWRIL